MRSLVVSFKSGLNGGLSLPGDKSIAHRAIILSALAQGKTSVRNIPLNEDCLDTINVFKKLGIKIVLDKSSCVVTIYGRGLSGLSKPKLPIFIRESGTTFRLLLGVLAGQNFKSKLNAGTSLSLRPMLRVIHPLRLMGAAINAREIKNDEYPPVTISGGNLKRIIYKLPVASAQVKSAILLAALFARGVTKIIEPVKTRDHTERLLKLFKSTLKVQGNVISIKGGRKLEPAVNLSVPADISSAAFFIVAASIIPGSNIIVRNVGLNPRRIGIIKVLKRMGAQINIRKNIPGYLGNEPSGDILVKSSCLRATKISKDEVPSLVDELPILMVASCFASGESVFEGVSELRVKETDRIKSMLTNLSGMGAKIRVSKSRASENIIIEGVKVLCGSRVRSFGDHRTAMSMVVAGIAATGKTHIDDISCINKSFPDFIKVLNSLT